MQFFGIFNIKKLAMRTGQKLGIYQEAKKCHGCCPKQHIEKMAYCTYLRRDKLLQKVYRL
jgi:hypothetical protein